MLVRLGADQIWFQNGGFMVNASSGDCVGEFGRCASSC